MDLDSVDQFMMLGGTGPCLLVSGQKLRCSGVIMMRMRISTAGVASPTPSSPSGSSKKQDQPACNI